MVRQCLGRLEAHRGPEWCSRAAVGEPRTAVYGRDAVGDAPRRVSSGVERMEATLERPAGHFLAGGRMLGHAVPHRDEQRWTVSVRRPAADLATCGYRWRARKSQRHICPGPGYVSCRIRTGRNAAFRP